MKIIVAEHYGMCFGVRDAIAQAEQLAHEAPLTILGELVHNPIVRERLRSQGVAEASFETVGTARRAVRSDESHDAARPAVAPYHVQDQSSPRFMITAHGVSDARRATLRESGLDVVDGTCPLVRHAHEQLKQLVAIGYSPVVIGKRGHVEVVGLTEDFPGACIVDLVSEVSNLPLSDRYGVISQTTQPIEHVWAIVAEIRRQRSKSEVRFVDTVCKPTKDRQLALTKLITQTELIVVVGGRESNNTRQLVETCRAAGRRAIHIERAEQLGPGDFENVGVVGLTAGTSTLPETVEAVFRRLKQIGATRESRR
jgi:4-hydroxy-3-methylbut-2-enyl diphosphate reductase